MVERLIDVHIIFRQQFDKNIVHATNSQGYNTCVFMLNVEAKMSVYAFANNNVQKRED